MPESAEKSARRRQAVTMLQIAECGCRYAASQLANGTGPVEARAVALEMAAELSTVAEALRRLARIEPAERRAVAAELAALGMSHKQIADRVGVAPATVWGYLHGRT